MRRRFLGGVHPVSYKESTRRKPIMPLEEPPKQVAIPLTMCTGGGAVPVVKPGDKVTVGQVIAKPEEGGVYVHSSVSGRVRAIEPRPHPWGGRWDAIVIDNDGQDTACPDLPEPMDWSRMDRAQVLERICQAGITSMGGGASPTHLRIARSVGRVDTLIVSAAECEPYLTADHRLLLEHGDQVLQSVQMLSQLLRADRAVLVVAGDKLNAVEFLERRLRRKRRSVELVTIETRYPLGMEKTAGAHHHRPGGAPGPVGRGCEVRRVQCGHRLYGPRGPSGGAARHPPGGHSERRGRSPAPEPVGAHRDPSALPAGVGGGPEGGAGHHPHRRAHDRDGPDGSGGPGW